MRIALATCARLPEPDPDDAPLRAALRSAGVDVCALAWDGADDADASAFDACVVRSTWNYHETPDRFLGWVDRTANATRLVNPAGVIRWNVHKGYLRELERAGVPTVPTEWVLQGSSGDVADTVDRRGWADIVIKPAVSAASFLTRSFSRRERRDAQRFLTECAAQRDMMIQPYLRGVDSAGERAIVWIDGAATHVVRKSPRFAGGAEHVSDAALEPTAAERAFAEQAIAARPGLAGQILYARIDVMPGEDGAPLLSELELIEPSLYFPQSPAALRRFVDGLLRRLSPPGTGPRSQAAAPDRPR